MANFSVNQSRQMYVMKSDSHYQALTISAIGDIQLKTTDNGLNKEAYFLYKGADGNIMRSDFIPTQNLNGAEVIAAADMATTLRKVDVTVATNLLNDSKLTVSDDYVLNINFKGFFSPGDDSQYYKSVVVRASEGTYASDFYKAMVKALNKAFAREDGATATSNPYLKFGIYVSGTGVLEETSGSFAAATATKLVIEEKEQEWILGTMPQRRIMFDLFPGTVWTGGDDVIWAAQDATTGQYYSEASSPTVVGNGKKIADLEWFCMGERGDQYRGMGYPNTIHTEYLVNSASAYHVLELHYAFTDTGVNSYRTEKEITIVTPTQAEMIKLVKAIQTTLGIEVAKSKTARNWTWT